MWVLKLLLGNELSGKIYTGAYLQSHSYKHLAELWLYAVPKWLKSCAQTFLFLKSVENFRRFHQKLWRYLDTQYKHLQIVGKNVSSANTA